MMCLFFILIISKHCLLLYCYIATFNIEQLILLSYLFAIYLLFFYKKTYLHLDTIKKGCPCLSYSGRRGKGSDLICLQWIFVCIIWEFALEFMLDLFLSHFPRNYMTLSSFDLCDGSTLPKENY